MESQLFRLIIVFGILWLLANEFVAGGGKYITHYVRQVID